MPFSSKDLKALAQSFSVILKRSVTCLRNSSQFLASAAATKAFQLASGEFAAAPHPVRTNNAMNKEAQTNFFIWNN